jgi:hypothetical protein
VLNPCITVTGVVYSIKTELDGDIHIRLTVDIPYVNLINAANIKLQLGKLVVEPICETTVNQADAVALCAADKDPIEVSQMKVKDHVMMIGRYVTDKEHDDWAELHPLYAWSKIP